MNNIKNYKKIIGDRLATLEEILGLKPKKMADIGGCSRATYYRYRKGESEPTMSFLNNILKNETKINAKWLLTGTGAVLNTENNSDPVYEKKLDPEQIKFLNIPLFSMANGNGNEGKLPIDQWNNPSQTLPLCNMFIKEIVKEKTEKLFALSVKCNSMSPEIISGSLVLADRSKTDITVDGIFVIHFDGVIRLKLAQRLPDNRVKLTTLNKKFDPIEIKLDQHKNFKVLGRIVWVGTPY